MTTSKQNANIERERARIIETMEQRHGTHQPDWRWDAEPTNTRGWWSVWQQGPNPLDILIGGRGYLGPGDVELWLSSNPMIHGYAETNAVLTDATTNDPAALIAEIERRTLEARQVARPHPTPPVG